MNTMILATSIDWPGIIFGLLGGLGLFLYGIYIMGEALKKLAGNRLKEIIEKLTGNPFKGLLVGMVVTVIIQSSSATTSISISLIRAGLMTLPQAIGVIMGANIGTTVTAFLIGLNVTRYSFLFIGIGAFLIFFFRKRMVKEAGVALFGFGLLFFGLDQMGAGIKSLAEQAVFNDFMLRLSNNPILGLMAGIIVTAIVQSSSASTGIVQNLYANNLLTLKGTLPILLGNNIGTTITAVIAAIGGSIAAKRASIFHVLFNFLGAIIFLILLNPFYELINAIQEWLMNHAATGQAINVPEMTIAFAHIIFNVSVTLLLIWFVKQIEALIIRLVPGTDHPYGTFSEDILNEGLAAKSPALALKASATAIEHMANAVKTMYKLTIDYGKTRDKKWKEEGEEQESIINAIDRLTHEYLVKVSASVTEKQSKTLSRYMDTIRDLERIGDHCDNILEIFEHIYDNKSSFSEEAWQDLDEMFHSVGQMLEWAIQVIQTEDLRLAEAILELETQIDRLEKKARKRHTLRVNEGICTADVNVDFIEILSNLERIGDHCSNIAEYTINKDYYVIIDEPEYDFARRKATH